jgi:hypothetical protein
MHLAIADGCVVEAEPDSLAEGCVRLGFPCVEDAQSRKCTGREARAPTVGAARQDDGHLGAKDQSCAFPPSDIDKGFVEDIADIETGYNQNVGVASHFGKDTLRHCRFA